MIGYGFLSKYVYVILASVVIENFIDVVLPSGRMSLFVKNIIGVFIFALILAPIVEILQLI